MRARLSFRTLALATAVFSVAACEPGISSREASFQRNYSVARNALEKGNYSMAIKQYAVMIPEAGPLQPRLRLEYSHALLREGRYQDAANVAGALAKSLKGSDRAAALAVKGTAEHELALAALDKGDYGANTEQRLRAARSALDEMLKLDADMDPQGTMASRRKDIRLELKQVRKNS